jgi:predicted transposase/invertase (TIGR01784 family)
LEQELWQEIHILEGENMPYVTSIERHALKQGRLEGIELGKKEGIEQGIEQGKLEAAQSLLGIVPDDVILEKIGLTEQQLNELKARISKNSS